jgi:hypothetical protein
LDDCDGFRGAQRTLEHRRVTQKSVELGKNELGNGHVLVVLDGTHPTISLLVPR